MQKVEAEELLCLLDHLFGPVEALRMHLEDGCRIDR